MVRLAKGMEVYFIQPAVDESAVKMGIITKLFENQVLVRSVSNKGEFEYSIPWSELNNTLFLSLDFAADVLRKRLNQNVETIKIRYIRSPSRDISIAKIGDIVTVITKGSEKTGTVVGFRYDAERSALQMGVEVNDTNEDEQKKAVVAITDNS